MTRTRNTFLAVLAVLLSPVAANADLITWDINGVFDDGTELSGMFTADTDTSTLTDWTISVMTGVLSAFTYDMTNSFFGGFDYWGANSNSFAIGDNLGSRYVNLSFTSSIFVAGVLAFDTSISLGGTWECDNCSTVRWLVEGGATSVPEPGTLTLLGIGLFGMGLARRRKV